MKPVSNNINNSAEFMRHQNRRADVSGFTNRQNSQVSFGAGIDISKVASKASEIVNGSSQTLSKENCEFINKVIGGNFFNDKLSKCGYNIGDSSFVIKQPKLVTDLINTIKYPFWDMWLDIAASLIKNPKNDSIIARHIEKMNLEKNKELLFNIASSFDKNNPEKFANTVANNITQITRNYRSRDERTLNRILTATVSALYSSNDFFNISMLQKDDKNEANKAKKMRLKQELFRMGLSAGLTFITMGALDKHIKNSMGLSALSIAGSSLLSEVASRLLSKTPLRWLSPEEAKKISEKINEKKQAKTNSKPDININKEKNNATGKVSFSSNDNKNIFKDFANQDGSFLPITLLNKADNSNFSADKNDIKKEGKGKNNKFSIIKIVLAAAGIAGAIHFLSKTPPGKTVTSVLKNIEDFIKNKTTVIDGAEFEKFKTEVNKFNGDKELSEIMKEYSSMLDNTDKVTIKSERFIIAGLYNGITKIFKTMYTLLSMPAKWLDGKISKFLKVPADTTANMANNNKALGALYKIFDENKGNNGKISEEIKKRTRNFENCIETGDLANFSRTLVTVIGSYFFVNDYRNKVLIESGGKDTEGASAEAKQRLLHKLANFIINGTIMNVGNSLFKGPLNSSLISAGLIAIGEETTNEALVRKSTCQPILKKKSRQEIIDFEEKQLNKKGLMGKWSRFFRKITGKKTLSQKAGIDKNKIQETAKN